MVICFWLLIFLCIYGYVGYPLLLFILTHFFGSKRQDTSFSTKDQPCVNILIAAHNEEETIGNKLNSLLQQDYPPEKFDIWVLDDGSTDNTVAEVERFTDRRLHLLSLPRQGKAHALNRGMRESHNEIAVFSDADTIWQSSTLTTLIAPFAHFQTGAVAGRLSTLTGLNHLGTGDNIYHKYESLIRKWETNLSSAVSADGGLLALRRELWQELPQDVTDDFYISTSSVCQGKDLVFAEMAIAYDTGVEKAKSQFNKRVRITVRGMTSLWRRRELFNPFRFGIYSFFLFSHKLIRRLVPCFGLLLLPASITLCNANTWYSLLLAVQVLFYAFGLLGLLDKGKRLPKIFSLIGFVLLGSYGLLVGVLLFFRGKRYTYWSPVQNR